MSGFKNTVLSHLPKLFLTFDGDSFDPAARTLISTPQTFLDESGYASNCMLHNEDALYPAYRMGIPSLVDIEQTDQHSCAFGWYGNQPGAISSAGWPKSFIEVEHQTHLAFADNLGSYTVGFFVNKVNDDTTWRNIQAALGDVHYTDTLLKRWARKAGSFDIYYEDFWTGPDFLVFVHPAGTLSWQVPGWFYNKKNFVVCTWSVTLTNPDTYLLEAHIMVNGHIYASFSNTVTGGFPTSVSTSAIEIAGTINASVNMDDRQTSNTQLDQIFVLNSALTQDEVCRLYRKSKTYDNLVLLAQASAYWPMTDIEDPSDFTMLDLVGYNNGVYQGGTAKILRQQSPPSQILGGSSVYFHDSGMAIAHRTSIGYTPVFSFGGNWVVDMWVMFSNTDRSVIWACQQDDYPHQGVLLEANMRNNLTAPGHLQFSISQDYQISSMLFDDFGLPYNFNDGKFHHVAMVRKGSQIYLWIDGRLHGVLTAPPMTVSGLGPGQVYVMGAAPGLLNTQGRLSAVTVYSYALDDAEIRMRNTFSLIYRIQGTVTLEGNPYQATLRAYLHQTGALARETLSAIDSGDYLINLYDNSQIDLVVMNKQDSNIRYRVYGPITPAEYTDLP